MYFEFVCNKPKRKWFEPNPTLVPFMLWLGVRSNADCLYSMGMGNREPAKGYNFCFVHVYMSWDSWLLNAAPLTSG